MEKLGIIAGAGELPVLLAQAAIEQGRLPIIIQVTKTPSEHLAGITPEVHSFGVGQLQKMTRTLLDSGVRETALIGKVHKGILLRPFRVDRAAAEILATTRQKGAAAIVSAIIEYLESNGLRVIEQHRFLKHLLPQPGVLTPRRPTEAQWTDLRYAIDLARQIADLNIGQTVVVKDGIPLAIEAIEDTNEAIRRGGRFGSRGVVVGKAAGASHDFRVDVPTVGIETLTVLHEVHAHVLAIEANRTFMLDRAAFCRQADRWKICIVAVE